jgi:hypothetical protein
LAVAVSTGPSFAATTSVTDPSGDYPDIRKLTLENKQTKVVLTQKYTDIELVQVETLYIKWQGTTYYRINRGNYDDDPQAEVRFILVTEDGDKEKSCPDLNVSRSNSTDTAIYRVPRSCIPKAADRVKAQGVASAGVSSSDQTKVTDRIARG